MKLMTIKNKDEPMTRDVAENIVHDNSQSISGEWKLKWSKKLRRLVLFLFLTIQAIKTTNSFTHLSTID